MTTHKVYTEMVEIEFLKEFVGFIACEDSNHLQEGNEQDVRLTTNDEKVDCVQCLEFMGKN